MIVAERTRQIVEEGYDEAHDAGHAVELLKAGWSYLNSVRLRVSPNIPGNGKRVPYEWPWAAQHWKPSEDLVRDLVKSGGLIAATIDSILAARAARAVGPFAEETLVTMFENSDGHLQIVTDGPGAKCPECGYPERHRIFTVAADPTSKIADGCPSCETEHEGAGQ